MNTIQTRLHVHIHEAETILDASTGLAARWPKQRLIQGVEWNVRGHEHASVAFIDTPGPKAVSDFEYQFDASDKDASREKEFPRPSGAGPRDGRSPSATSTSMSARDCFHALTSSSRSERRCLSAMR